MIEQRQKIGNVLHSDGRFLQAQSHVCICKLTTLILLFSHAMSSTNTTDIEGAYFHCRMLCWNQN